MIPSGLVRSLVYRPSLLSLYYFITIYKISPDRVHTIHLTYILCSLLTRSNFVCLKHQHDNSLEVLPPCWTTSFSFMSRLTECWHKEVKGRFMCHFLDTVSFVFPREGKVSFKSSKALHFYVYKGQVGLLYCFTWAEPKTFPIPQLAPKKHDRSIMGAFI